MSRNCRICTGSGPSICGNCNRERIALMVKFNIDTETAEAQLRESIIEEELDEAAEVEPQTENFWGTERVL
jgi:hypothetical protein